MNKGRKNRFIITLCVVISCAIVAMATPYFAKSTQENAASTGQTNVGLTQENLPDAPFRQIVENAMERAIIDIVNDGVDEILSESKLSERSDVRLLSELDRYLPANFSQGSVTLYFIDDFQKDEVMTHVPAVWIRRGLDGIVFRVIHVHVDTKSRQVIISAVRTDNLGDWETQETLLRLDKEKNDWITIWRHSSVATKAE